MDKLKKINIQIIKKILQRRGYKVSKKHESFFSIYYTAFASIFLILIFYAIPFVINISSKVFKKNEMVINTSNKNFNRVMEGKEIESEKNSENDEVNYKELFVDIFDFDISEKDTIRLSASTLNQLF
jgi:hypothetical protein